MERLPGSENGVIIPRARPRGALYFGRFQTVSGRFTCKQLSHNSRNGGLTWY